MHGIAPIHELPRSRVLGNPEGTETGAHRFYKLKEDGNYEHGQSRKFAARLSEYVGSLIEKAEASE